ncbi:MAG: PEGA domain-containing protein [Gammaproteobacteria bacterium]|nr:PEGA domain-containing protein [Gammaproteobacteria bacterium]
MNTLDHQLQSASRRSRARGARLAAAAAAVILLLAVALPLAYFGRVTAFYISPPLAAERATVSLIGGAGWVFLGRAWWFGAAGDGALLRVEADGFISREVTVGAAPVSVAMTEAPAAVVVTTAPALAQTRWRVDGAQVATGARFELVLRPGVARIEADHEFFRVEELRVEVAEGKGVARHIDLTPVAGRLDIRSEPAGARVFLDGATAGVTPVVIDAAGGAHRLRVALDGYRNIEEEITVTNRAPRVSRDYRLEPQRAEARVSVSPPGGTLRVNGVATPAGTLKLAAGRAHRLRYEKPGYVALQREVTLAADERADIEFDLQMEFGEVTVRAAPSADLTVNGQPAGATPQTLRLQALPHRIVLTRAGHRAVTAQVTPRADAPLLIDEILLPEAAAREAEATRFTTAAPATAAIRMKYFDPRGPAGRFTMGAPRGEKFRRANEFQRPVELTKPFYVGVTEVTEAQFAAYQPGAIVAGAARNLPARNVSWPDAAKFCNWLSAQDGLQPAYQIAAGRVHGFDPTADGYRLLSEAEWEWLARVAGRAAGRPVKFVWGADTTIPARSGNFADQSAKGTVARYIPRYNDGFAGVAAVASFAADAAGLYDMAGNVSEWMHDRYILQPPVAGAVARNPFGAPGDGDGDGGMNQFDAAGDASRVIKGANFRTASVTGLRSSFREGLTGARDDVGFRVARYLYGKE